MKTLPLRARDSDNWIDFLKFARLAVEGTPPDRGIDVAEMRRRHRVLDAIDALPEKATELPLEDADATVLADCTKTCRWAVVSSEILAFDDAVQTMMMKPDDKKKDKDKKAPAKP